MQYINKLLDKARDLSSSPTDTALAIKLEVTRQSVSNWRHGTSIPDNLTCAKIALITNTPFNEMVGLIYEERTINSKDKKVWKQLAQVAVLFMCTLPIASIYAGNSAFTSCSLYIM